MKENTETTVVSVRGAEAREIAGTAETDARLGKFKSVDALLDAYNSLEAEFTRRSQRLRELEGRATNGEAVAKNGDQSESPSDKGGAADSAGGSDEKASFAVVSDELREKVIAEYLSKIKREAPNILAGGGSYVGAPSARAKTLEDAAAQATEIFKKYVQGE